MLRKVAAAQEFRERGLRELVSVQIGSLLHQAKSLDGSSRSDDPSNAQAGERDLGKTVNVNDEIRTVHLFKRWNALVAGVKTSVDVVLDNGHLMTGSQLQQLATRCEWYRGARGILKIRRQHNELDAIGSERGFERFEIDAQRLAGLGVGVHGNTKATSACAIENCSCAGIGRIFEDHAIAGAHKRFADQIQRLLTTIG